MADADRKLSTMNSYRGRRDSRMPFVKPGYIPGEPSASASRRKARELVLGNGKKVVVDIICRRCGHEQPSNCFRLRCQYCDSVLKQIKRTKSLKLEQPPSTTPSRKSEPTLIEDKIVNGVGVEDDRSSKSRKYSAVPMSHVKLSMLGNKSRSKHSKRAFTKRLKTRELTLGDMSKIVIDIVCGTCGHEQPFNYCRLRCQKCDDVLRQIASGDVSEQLRSVGGARVKNAQGRQLNLTNSSARTKAKNNYDANNNKYDDTNPLIQVRVQIPRYVDALSPRKATKRSKARGPIYLGNLRAEAGQQRGDWLICTSMKSGHTYYFNVATCVATYIRPADLEKEDVDIEKQN
jgi:Zn finger protein HypA/HybF involved in hydrogenase expression